LTVFEDLPALLNDPLNIAGIKIQRYIYYEHGHIMSLIIQQGKDLNIVI